MENDSDEVSEVESEGEENTEYVLVPVVKTDGIDDILRIANYVAEDRGERILLLEPDVRGTDVSGYPDAYREKAKQILQSKMELDISVEGITRTGDTLEEIVTQTAELYPVDAVVFEAVHDSDLLERDTTQKIVGSLDCDTVVINVKSDLSDISSVLLPVSGGPHSELATGIAGVISANTGTSIDILHIIEDDYDSEARDTRID
ncbi:MAG: hypothetical protein SXQ77_09290 [Halobacteria archaeon]|nr:hypothetical protein [Halobacteria archaeon]